jgi:hypothetical protein
MVLMAIKIHEYPRNLSVVIVSSSILYSAGLPAVAIESIGKNSIESLVSQRNDHYLVQAKTRVHQ